MASSDPRPESVERLLAERAWVRRLAARLLRDPGEAEDLVQEASLAAIERAPASVSRPRAWLGTVVRNLLRNRLRSRRRRVHHEGRVPPGRAPEDPAAVAERAELVERVARQVLRLPEPYRTAALLRWFDELPPAEIARRTGSDPEAVRTRLRRALEMLRTSLDEEHGSRRAWALPLAHWLGGSGGATLGAAAGGLVVGKKTMVAAGLLLLLAAGASLTVLLARGGGSDPLPDPEAPGVARAGEAGGAAASPTLRAADDARAEGSDLGHLGAVEGTVRDSDGRPVPGVVVATWLASDTWRLSLHDVPPLDATPSAPARHAETRSGADGRFRIEGLRYGVRYGIAAEPERPRAGSLTVVQAWPWEEARVLLRVSAGVEVRGRVVDARGRGFAAWVAAMEPIPSSSRAASRAGRWQVRGIRTDGEGRFTLDAVPPGTVLLGAFAPGHAGRQYLPVVVPAPGEVVVALEDAGGASIGGRVRDAAGPGIAGALVTVTTREDPGAWLQAQSAGTATTDAEGAWRVDGLFPGRVQDVRVRAPGYAEPGHPFGYDLPLRGGETTSFDVTLARAVEVEGRVLDPAGGPVAGAEIEVRPRVEFGPPDQGVQRVVSDAQGRFRAAGLPWKPLRVSATKGGWEGASVESGVPEVGTRLVSVHLTLRTRDARAGAPVRGRATLADGSPLAGTVVTAVGGATSEPVQVAGRPDGSFLLEGLDLATDWQLRADAPGHASEVRSLGSREGVELVLRPVGRLAGRVVDGSGAPLSDLDVWCRSEGRSRNAQTDLDGRFEVQSLPAGRWTVYAAVGDRAVGESVETDVRDGGASEVAVRVPDASRVAGVVVDSSGRPVIGVQVSLAPWPGAYAYADDDGRFEMRTFGPGEVRFAVNARPVPGAYAPGDVGIRLLWDRPRRVPVDVRLEGPDGEAIERARLSFRSGNSGTSGFAGGGHFYADLEPGTERFDLEVLSVEDAEGRRIDARPLRVTGLDPAASPFRFRLAPGASVSGRVLDPAGRGVAGVRLHVAPAAGWGGVPRFGALDASQETTTGADGSFRAVGLDEGRVVIAALPGEPWVEPAAVEADAGREGIAIRLERGSAIAGRVVDPSGHPVPNALVRADLPREARAAYGDARLAPRFVREGWTTTADDEGAFRLAGLAPSGRYALGAQAPPWLPATVPDVAPGTEGLVLRVTLGAFVEGEVVGEGWEDAGAVWVEASSATGPRGPTAAVARTTLERPGAFRLGPLAPGTYRVTARCAGHEGGVETVPAPSSGVRLVLPRALFLRGRLEGEDMGRFDLAVLFPDGTSAGTATDEAGAFLVRNVRDQRVTIVATREGDERYGLLVDVHPTEGPFRVPLRPGLEVAGRVEGIPEGARLHVQVRGRGLQRRVDLGGGREFGFAGLPPGPYEVEAFAPNVVIRVPEVLAGTLDLVLRPTDR